MKLNLAKGLTLDFKKHSKISTIDAIGIVNLRKVVLFAVSLKRKVDTYTSDGSFDWFERVLFGLSIMGVVRLLPLIDLIKKELDDLDSEELKELLDLMAKGFGVKGELVDKYTTKAYLDDFIDFIEAFKTFINLTKKNKL